MTIEIWKVVGQGVIETFQMVIISAIFAYLVGFPLGVALAVTGKDGIVPHTVINSVLGTVTNILRSVPFLILLVVLIPLTRLITGSSIGTVATIVPLSIGAMPIVARMVESSLKEIDGGIVEAAKAMGASTYQIIVHFMIPEATPSLILGASINLATILGYSAMAGCIGGGGLGAIALNYGFYRYQTDILLVTVAILIVIVWVFQETGTRLSIIKRH